MKILCPTCSGKGSIPDPKCMGIPMYYVGPNGETCPSVFCQTCSGSGWVIQEAGCNCHKGFQPPQPHDKFWPLPGFAGDSFPPIGGVFGGDSGYHVSLSQSSSY